MDRITQEVEEFLKRPSYSKESFESERMVWNDQITIKPHICLKGLSASGKTKTIEALKHVFSDQYEFVSGGDFHRKKSEELGMVFDDYLRKQASKYDEACESYLRRKALTCSHLIGEGRIIQCSMDQSYKVYLDCPLGIRAQRRHAQLRKDKPEETKDLTIWHVCQALKKRDADDKKRLALRYPKSVWDKEDYDLIVSTLDPTPEVVETIVKGFNAWMTCLEDERAAALHESVPITA